MRGKYTNNKIIYITPIYNSLSNGSWKTGWGGISRSGGEEEIYSIENPNSIDLIEGKIYKFKLVNNIAIIEK